MNGETILEKLIAYKSSVKKKINSGNSITINELYEGQIVEVEIIIDKIQYIEKGKSAKWEDISEIFMDLFDLIDKAKTLQELIFSLYRGISQSSVYTKFDKIDLLWEKSDEQIEKEESISREKSKQRSNNTDLLLEF
jgi:hypothetical protein